MSKNMHLVQVGLVPLMILLIGLSMFWSFLEINLSMGIWVGIAEFIIYINMLTWPVTLGYRLFNRASQSDREFWDVSPKDGQKLQSYSIT